MNYIEFSTADPKMRKRTEQLFGLLEKPKGTELTYDQRYAILGLKFWLTPLKLIEEGIDPGARISHPPLGNLTVVGNWPENTYSLLDYAVINGHTEYIEPLVNEGISINEPGGKRGGYTPLPGHTPLMYAAAYSQISCIHELLELGASPLKTTRAQTVMHVAAKYNRPECIALFAGKGVDIDINPEGSTPFLEAATAGSRDALELLIALGANVWQRGLSIKSTALHYAAQNNRANCIMPLLEVGLDVDVHDDNGETPLHLAATANAPDAMQLLLEAGADIEAVDYDGKITALHHAAFKSDAACLEQLIAAGARINQHDEDGKTALIAAIGTGYGACIKPLLNAGASVWPAIAHDDIDYTWREYLSPVLDHQFMWQDRLNKSANPIDIETMLALVSVMPLENIKSIPEPRELAEQLFRTLPHTETLNDLYQKYFGKPRPPQVNADLKTLRQRAQHRGVGL